MDDDTPEGTPGPGHLVADRYRLRAALGRGAMGAVWLATDELLGRDVAVKQLHSTAGLDPEVAHERRERALREGRIAARLDNPHAVAVLDVALADGDPWLVMEHLPSRDLAAVIASAHVLPVPQVAQIGAQVADALADAHAAGIVHRDVKPANVLVGEGGDTDGVVKIADFGIARARDEVTVTGAGLISGTPAYFAPEVARGAEPTPASDVHALGATLFACLEGTPPYGVDVNAIALLHRIASGEHAAPTRAAAVEPVLLRMLDPDPDRRPTMVEVRDELAAVAAGRTRGVAEVLSARTELVPLPFAVVGIAVATGAAAGLVAAGLQGGAGAVAAGGVAADAAGASAVGAAAVGSGEAGVTAAVAVPATVKAGGIAAALTQPVAVAVGVGAVVLTAGTAYLLTGGSPSPAPAAAAPVTTSAAAPTTTAVLTAAEAEQAVRSFAALLPGDPDGALARSGPTLQAVGADALRDYLAEVTAVGLGAVTAQDGGAVTAELVLTLTDGTTTTETVAFTVTRPATPTTTATTTTATTTTGTATPTTTPTATTPTATTAPSTSAAGSSEELLVDSAPLAALVAAGGPTTSAPPSTTAPTTTAAPTTAPRTPASTTPAPRTTTAPTAAPPTTTDPPPVDPSEVPSTTTAPPTTVTLTLTP